ncbi:putative glycosyltransferase EpsD [Thalassoglobus neptunius]|uniref:Putative glycosyltransferase EpsD n=1 Tax=Thalassoglobus neptunius TaxID=1938619 RepID=A0A5C5WR81_9PLAN|nr:glycosyltransferase family 4 protein [Thalassoglobus neptunius]TWT52322.1 putative glycosyltransferase EpsD [Thalassoglobus neptunius]
MKVIHVITRLILGGAQENTLHTVEDQHSLHGDDVTLVIGPSEGPEGTLVPRAMEGGFPVEIVPSLKRSILPLEDMRAYRHLVRLFKERQPDLVHTHSSKAGILGRLAARKARVPVVHSIHGAAFHYGQSRVAYGSYVAAEKYVSRWTEKFICVADAMRDAYLAEGISTADRYVTVYSGFDVDPFLSTQHDRDAIRQEMGFRPDDVVVGKIGRLFHLKGHEFLIESARQIVRKNPRVKFLFVGDGILRQQFEEQISQYGMSDSFHFTGLVPTTRIPELMSAMDIVAHTSQWEGLARVLPQGLISGKPVVSYDVGGAGEVVIPGETGYLLKRDSIDELTTAILELADDQQLRQRLGEEGRRRFADQFRHQTMTEKIRDVYRDVLS